MGDSLSLPKFGEINWKNDDFITPEEFKDACTFLDVQLKEEDPSNNLDQMQTPRTSAEEVQKSFLQKIKKLFNLFWF